MDNKTFHTIWQDALETTDIDAFVSDWALSSTFLPDDRDIDPALVQQLTTLWHIANDPFADMLNRMEMTQTQCSVRFCIPLRTIQDWTGDRRQCLSYIRLMMAETTGLLRLRDYETQKM